MQPSRPRKERQQVAAVCYRIRKRGIEFLLVQTRGGRWIFPKGGVEFSLTHAQSAALEAFEEAGVHGRMEEIPFARYFRRKSGNAAQPGRAVTAHLCEVSRLEPPQESNRTPTWFSAEKAKQRLLEGRAQEFGVELARVVDIALSRVQRLHAGARNTPTRARRDGLQRVQFEADEEGRVLEDLTDALARYSLRQRREAHPGAAIEVAVQAHLQKVLRIGPAAEIRRPILRLGVGADSPAEALRNITAIDSKGKANPSKPGTLPSSRHKVPGKLVR